MVRNCASLNVDPALRKVKGHEAKVVCLPVFAWRCRVGCRRGTRAKPVRSDAIASALLAVGQGITDLGEKDPCFKIFG